MRQREGPVAIRLTAGTAGRAGKRELGELTNEGRGEGAMRKILLLLIVHLVAMLMVHLILGAGSHVWRLRSEMGSYAEKLPEIWQGVKDAIERFLIRHLRRETHGRRGDSSVYGAPGSASLVMAGWSDLWDRDKARP